MEPTYHVGSLLYVKKIAPEAVQVGDPITFVLDENLTVVTHRVVEIAGRARDTGSGSTAAGHGTWSRCVTGGHTNGLEYIAK